jgi:hypothetical protein
MTETEIAASMMVAKDMLYVYCLLESLELKVELPMVLEMGSSGPVDNATSYQNTTICHKHPVVSCE